MVIRKAKLAGSWYSGSKERLKKDIEQCFLNKEFGPGSLPSPQENNERKIIGAVSPHAGYRFSGPCAAYSYFNIFKENTPDTIIVIGFYHRGMGPDAFLRKGEWETPLGNLSIDEDFTDELINNSKVIVPNERVFINSDENSIELQMPFIKFCAGKKDTKVVPIKITSHDYDNIELIASDIANAIKKLKKNISIISSSDMSHYNIFNEEQLNILKEIDNTEITQFRNMDGKKFLDPISYISKKLYNTFSMGGGPTVCGRHTIATLMLTCKKLDALNAKCLKYYTSKDIEYSTSPWTVGYFSGAISTE
ncbi:MAG: AmmeMemoRadiSam system protein B [Promethearchaeota archaeon]